jgi:site-specific DNA-methyltransferase (adenine-specific)
MKSVDTDSVDLIASDIPYGICYDKWDIIHNNKNNALLGTSKAQIKAGSVFKMRGKPLNGWSEDDKKIPMEYYEWCNSWVRDWLRVLKPGASSFVFAGRRMVHRCICAFEDNGFIFKDMIAWNKEKAAHRAQRISCVFGRRNDEKNVTKWNGWKVGNLRPVFEPILWFMKPYKIGATLADNVIENDVGAWDEAIFDRYNQLPNNLISLPADSTDSGLHPTQKPLALMKLIIELTTKKSQLVCDPFAGSGTTIIGALQLGRNFIGIEKEQEYYRIALRRLKKEYEDIEFQFSY